MNQGPWFIVAEPKDANLTSYAGQPVKLSNWSGDTRAVTHIYSVLLLEDRSRLVWVKDCRNVNDFTREQPARRVQLELPSMSATLQEMTGQATIKPCFVVVDAEDELVDVLLRRCDADVVLAALIGTRMEQHWCVEMDGKHYGLTGIEPLVIGEKFKFLKR